MPPFLSPFGLWELALVAVVTLQSTAMAYLHAPRWKALAFTLPFPFSTIVLASERPIETPHVLGLIVALVYIHGVRLLYMRLRVPIALSIVLGVLLYCAVSFWMLQWFPVSEASFWVVCGTVFAGGWWLYIKIPPRTEPGHRTPLPVWQKVTLVFAVVCGLVQVKEALEGFAALFPLAGVIGVYEARHSLWTVGRQVPVMFIVMTPMMAVTHLTQDKLGLAGGLAIGWLVFLVAWVPITRRQWVVKSP